MAYETLHGHTESIGGSPASYSVVDTVREGTPGILNKPNHQVLASILDDAMFISRNNSKLHNLSAYVLSVIVPEQIRENRELILRCLKEYIESDGIYDLLHSLPSDGVLHGLAFFNDLVTAEKFTLEDKVDYIKNMLLPIIAKIEDIRES